MFSIERMTCDHCAKTVKNEVNTLLGISKVDLDNKMVVAKFHKAQVAIEHTTKK